MSNQETTNEAKIELLNNDICELKRQNVKLQNEIQKIKDNVAYTKLVKAIQDVNNINDYSLLPEFDVSLKHTFHNLCKRPVMCCDYIFMDKDDDISVIYKKHVLRNKLINANVYVKYRLGEHMHMELIKILGHDIGTASMTDVSVDAMNDVIQYWMD